MYSLVKIKIYTTEKNILIFVNYNIISFEHIMYLAYNGVLGEIDIFYVILNNLYFL